MIYILTGPVHGGKTTFLKECLPLFLDHNIQVDGYLSIAAFEGQDQIGYDLNDLKENIAIPFIRNKGEADWQQVGSYYLIPKGLAKAEAIIVRSKAADLLIVDEIGPLELTGDGLWPILQRTHCLSKLVCLFVVREKKCKEFINKVKPYEVKPFSLSDNIALSSMVEEIADKIKG